MIPIRIPSRKSLQGLMAGLLFFLSLFTTIGSCLAKSQAFEEMLAFVPKHERQAFKLRAGEKRWVRLVIEAIERDGDIYNLLQSSPSHAESMLRAAAHACRTGLLTIHDFLSVVLLWEAWFDLKGLAPVVEQANLFDSAGRFTTDAQEVLSLYDLPYSSSSHSLSKSSFKPHETKFRVFWVEEKRFYGSKIASAALGAISAGETTGIGVSKAFLNGLKTRPGYMAFTSLPVGILDAVARAKNGDRGPAPLYLFGTLTSDDLYQQIKLNTRGVNFHFPGVTAPTMAHEGFMGYFIFTQHDYYHLSLPAQLPEGRLDALIQLYERYQSRLRSQPQAGTAREGISHQLMAAIADVEPLILSRFFNPISCPRHLQTSDSLNRDLLQSPALGNARDLMGYFHAGPAFANVLPRSEDLMGFVIKELLQEPQAYQKYFPLCPVGDIVRAMTDIDPTLAPLIALADEGRCNAVLTP